METQPLDLATSLQQTEAGIKKLMSSGLTRRAVLILLAHDSKLSVKTIEAVLDAAMRLSKYTEKPKP